MKYYKKWKDSEKIDFFRRLAELLDEGFSLSESIEFLSIMMPRRQIILTKIATELSRGEDLSTALRMLGLSETVLLQIEFASYHGSLIQTLRFTADHIQSLHKYRNQFIKLSTYPCVMLLFSFVLLIGVRSTILPTIMMMSNNQTSPLTEAVIYLLENMPLLIALFILLGSIIVLLVSIYLRRLTSLQKAILFSKLPLIGEWFKDYYSFQFSREVGYFLKNGHSIQQMITGMGSYQTASFIALFMNEARSEFMKGETFPSILSSSPLFYPEFHWIVYHGELTNQVGSKLLFYSAACYRQLEQKIERSLSFVQPVLFGVIGIFIVGIYVIIMLPLLNSMKGVLG